MYAVVHHVSQAKPVYYCTVPWEKLLVFSCDLCHGVWDSCIWVCIEEFLSFLIHVIQWIMLWQDAFIDLLQKERAHDKSFIKRMRTDGSSVQRYTFECSTIYFSFKRFQSSHTGNKAWMTWGKNWYFASSDICKNRGQTPLKYQGQGHLLTSLLQRLRSAQCHIHCIMFLKVNYYLIVFELRLFILECRLERRIILQ